MGRIGRWKKVSNDLDNVFWVADDGTNNHLESDFGQEDTMVGMDNHSLQVKIGAM